MSTVMCHVSRVMCQVSHFRVQVSFCSFFLLFLFFQQNVGASRWRVCYQQGQPRLFFFRLNFFGFLLNQPNFCQLVSVSVRFCQFLTVAVSFCPFLSVSVPFCPFCLFLSLSVRLGISRNVRHMCVCNLSTPRNSLTERDGVF